MVILRIILMVGVGRGKEEWYYISKSFGLMSPSFYSNMLTHILIK